MGKGKKQAAASSAGSVLPKRRGARKRRGQGRSGGEVFSFKNAGSKIGEFLGAGAGSLLGKIFGMGAYTVEQNVLLTPSGTIGPPPIFQTRPDGSVIVCHREYVGAISGASTYTTRLQQPINPSNPYLFPRLSQLALTFEEYEPLGLVFEYLTTSGTAVGSTNTALGTVMLATNYDVLSPPFQNKQELESYKFSTATVPCSSVYHPIECKPNQLVGANRYVSDPSVFSPVGTIPPAQSGVDRRLYDIGLFQVAAQGQQATNSVGEIWVSYCFKLMVPRMNPYASVAHITTDASCTAAIPLHGASITAGSTLVSQAVGSTFTIPSTGEYLVAMSWWGSSIGASATWALGANLTGVNCINGYTGTGSTTFISTVASAFFCVQCLTPGTGTANQVTIGGLTGMTGATGDIYILRRPALTGSAVTGF